MASAGSTSTVCVMRSTLRRRQTAVLAVCNNHCSSFQACADGTTREAAQVGSH